MNDVKSTHLIADFKHGAPMLSCRFDPTGRYVFGGAEDYQVWRWEIRSGKKVAYPTDAWVRGLAFSDEGKAFITGGYDGRLIWWPSHGTPKANRIVQAHKGWIRAIDVSRDGRTLASVGNDLVVRLWDARNGKKLRELKGHQSHIYNLAFHPDGDRLVTGDLKCNIIDWEIKTGRKVRTWISKSQIKYDKGFKAFIGGFRGMTFNAKGTRLACSGITNVTNAFAGVGNPSIVVYDWKSGKKQVEHLSKQKAKGVAWGLAFHPRGDMIGGVGGGSAYLMFWKPTGKKQYHEMKLRSDVRDLDLHKDGVRLAIAHGDRHMRLYKMAKKKTKKTTKSKTKKKVS